MPVKIVHLESLGNVTFSQNARSRTIRLRVKPNQEIAVSFPLYVSLREAMLFAEQHTAWVKRQQVKMKKQSPEFHEDIPVKTRSFNITFHKQPTKFSVKQVKNQISFFYPEQFNLNDAEVREKIEKLLTGIYRLEAKEYLPVRLSQLAVKHGFQFNNVSIRNNRSNWGSCSGKNNISLNLHLMKLPDSLIDVILLHELAHTKVKNHGPKFWSLLNSVTGNQAKQLTKEVKKYSPGLIQ
jgi:predicted metal-dependent hydrolase